MIWADCYIGFPASPSLGTQVTSATFHALANVLDLKELFIRDAIICKVAGRLSLSILAGTLSKPGALLEGRFKIIFALFNYFEHYIIYLNLNFNTRNNS